MLTHSKQAVAEILTQADVKIKGSRPWDIEVSNEKIFDRVIKDGTLGFGEGYMDGWWSSKSLDECAHKIFRANLTEKVKSSRKAILLLIKAKLTNMQSRGRAYEVGEEHYDKGNDLFERMLDPYMVYSCAYWKEAKTLAEAQVAKFELICKKIGLEKGMKVLDIGCGWGGFARYAAEKYGVEVTGITISKEQAKLAAKKCFDLPVRILVEDYRKLKGEFDRIVSVGMFEHVGYKNYQTFMKTASRRLKKDGLFLLHTIGRKYSVRSGDPWTNKYIFPNGMLPSLEQITKAVERLFVIEDIHNIGAHYDPTLMAWHDNFLRTWGEIQDTYSVRFKRMWEFYLLVFAGAFRARKYQVWQIVLSQDGVEGGYQSIR